MQHEDDFTLGHASVSHEEPEPVRGLSGHPAERAQIRRRILMPPVGRRCGGSEHRPNLRTGSVLERDVVVRWGGAAAAHRRARRLEVALVHGDVGLRGEAAAAVRGLVAPTEELDGVGDDLDRLALLAVLALPLAPLEAAIERDRAPLGEEARAVLALGAPDGDREVVRLVLPLARRLILTAGVG